MSRKPICPVAKLLAVFVAAALAGCDSGWVGPTKKPGPLPLSSPTAPTSRLVKTRKTFETTLEEVLWDEGKGPVPIRQRIKPVVDAVPKEVRDRFDNRLNPATNAAWGVVVSVNPDVLIVIIRERRGEWPFENWTTFSTRARAEYVHQRLENFWYLFPEPYGLSIHAGSLVPWSDEMYAVSTDPQVNCQRLKFENNQTTVSLASGTLVLRHHEDDVDVSRE